MSQTGGDRESAFQLLFAHNPVPMWVFATDTLQFLEVNDAAVAHYGYTRDEFLTMRIVDIRPAEDAPKLQEFLSVHRPPLRRAGAWRHRRKDGTIIDVEINSHTLEFRGRPAVLVVVQDVSERRRLEQQLLQSQKMEAIGRLAGGVAHDFNNILTTIRGYCDLTLESPLLATPLRPDIEGIKQAALSASNLTNQLLAFSRRQIIEPIILDVNRVLQTIDRMLQRLIGEDIRIELRLASGLSPVRIDPTQVEQIVMNLAINARDAMPGGGVLTIESANVELDDAYARQHLAVTPGQYVMIAVSDTGVGMDASVLAHVFEPFFTTKPLGKGTGLGLATVYGIVKQNHGNVWVYSEPMRGATFKIYFPALSGEVTAVTVPASVTATKPVGTETVLVVEDDAGLRLMVQKSLQRFGYTVLPTGSGSEALAIAASHGGPIDLLLTDVVMPGMNGPTLARQFATLHPAAKVLFCSGYTENAIVHHGVLDPGVQLLQKPYSPIALAQKVREVLDT